MPQYGVLVYAPAPADPAAYTTEHVEAIGRYPDAAKEAGAKVLGASYFAGQRGFAFEASTTARSIQGDDVAEGTFIGSDLVPAAFFVLSAPDLDTAVEAARLHPAAPTGGLEVRPLFPLPTP